MVFIFGGQGGWIEIEQNKVTSYGAQVAVEGSDPQHLWHEATWSLFQEIPTVDESQEKQFLKIFNPKRDRSPDFLVNWINSPIADRIDWLFVRASVRATDSQRHAAEDFNLKCLTKKGECANVCDLLPEAAKYYNDTLHPEELAFPHPRCR